MASDLTTEPQQVLWVTGAGSGMGRAVAVAASRQNFRVALSGRREEALNETAAAIAASGGQSLVVPMDATSGSEVESAHRRIVDAWGDVSHLVLAAGLNTPRRYWRDQSMEEFGRITETNLLSPARIVDLVLPGMRTLGDGVVVFVSSYSGWRFSPDAGVAYSASKTALSSLSESLNAQENMNGIRACHLCPGDVDTDFLEMRPVVPGDSDRNRMLTPGDIAETVMFVLRAPAHMCVNELVVSQTYKR